MRVGVVLGNFVPEDGGGFTFVAELIPSLVSAGAAHTDLELVIFCDVRAVSFVREACSDSYEVVGVPSASFLHRAVGSVRQWSPLLKRFVRQRSVLELSLQTHCVDFVWFIGGRGEVLDIPYAATVWDVQHRTHPWFPEVSSGNIWDGRELFFSTYLRRAAIIVTGTSTGKNQLQQYYQIDADRIVVLPHPTPQFAIKAGESRSNKRPESIPEVARYFFYPAQYWPHKNHATLIQAFSLIAKRDLSICLVFVGADKGNKQYLQELAKGHGVRDRVLFLGFVDRAELISLYKNSVALAYASFSGPENLPPLEAFALGCPVLNSDFPGAREQLGNAAVYFDPCSPASIADALSQISIDVEMRSQLIVRGLRRARSWQCSDFSAGVLKAIADFRCMRASWR